MSVIEKREKELDGVRNEYVKDIIKSPEKYRNDLKAMLGDNDAFFSGESGAKEFERLKSLSQEVGCDWLDFILFEGTHEFHKDDMQIERMVKDIM